MHRTPWWALASAGAAPVLLAGGLVIAQSRQGRGYNPVRDTISALAAHGASDRWVMGSALAGLGACHFITAMGLRPAGTTRRVVFAGGGVATLLVAAFPQPANGDSVAHTVAATIAFTSLGAWPVLGARLRTEAPLLTLCASTLGSAVLLGLVGWFASQVNGAQRGLAERAAAGAEAIWPLAVVITTRRAEARAEST